MRVLYAIHDFLPRHRAGSEIYAFELAREMSRRADVFVLAAEYDPSVPHGTLRWRTYEGLVVIEIVNNWQFRRFDETYQSERINAQLRHVLDATGPDVLHVHNLLNLSFDLPRMAKQRGIATVATLHDYTLVCPSGGQRVHVAESHVCDSIDANRCARCFAQSPLATRMRAAKVTRGFTGSLIGRTGRAALKIAPVFATSILKSVNGPEIDGGEVRRRLGYARQVFESVDLFVAPSRSMAEEFCKLGLARDRIQVSDYGFPPPRVRATGATGPPSRVRATGATGPPSRVRATGATGPPPGVRATGATGPPSRVRATDGTLPPGSRASARLRIGFVGTLVWHKGVHVLIEATKQLRGQYEAHVHGDTAVFPEYVAALRRAATGLPIVFHDGFDRGRVDDVYEGFDVLVVPSLWPENSPLVIHEAFMHQVPVVAARVGGVPELVGHEVNGLLYEPFDPGALAASLQRLIDDRELLGTLSARVSSVKSIEQDAREWEERYLRLCQAAEVHACT